MDITSPTSDFTTTRLSPNRCAAADPSAQRLLTTPLQVLILTITLAGSGTLPAHPYLLFWSYYETILKREAAKFTTHRQFFANHQSDITDLHQRVGVLLQMLSDVAGEARARLPRTQLWALARERMMEVGHEERDAEELADRIPDVATQRLVLLVAYEDDTVSFDVRSLQELTAARGLVDGDDATIRRNLTAAACNPTRRNTWLFAAGRLFADSDHRRDLVVSIVERCDVEGHWPRWLYPAAPALAADLLDDGLAATRPNEQRRLIDVVLRCLKGPMLTEIPAVAVGLAAAAAANPKHFALIRNELAHAMAGEPVQRAVAGALIYVGEFGTRIPGHHTDEDLRRPSTCAPQRPPTRRESHGEFAARSGPARVAGRRHLPGSWAAR
jgi:hypothetical protein